MKSKTALLFIMVFTIASLTLVSAQKNDFSGTWKLDRTKSAILEYFPTLVRIDVQIKGDSLLTGRTYESGDGQEYPFTENLTLDGKEYKITIYEMPRRSKATWSEADGTINIESSTTFTGSNGSEDYISKEIWKVDKANNAMTVSFKNAITAGESEGILVYNRADL